MTLPIQLRDERGVALPMAMIALVLLTTLMLAFSVLSQTEPVIASNQLRVTQARAMADSGVEHAVWALTAGNVLPGEQVPAGALANPLPPSLTGTPFDGTRFTQLGGVGGYTVRVTSPDVVLRPRLRRIVADGWTPNYTVADTRTKGHRRIQVDVEALPDLARDAPCALCVRGDLQVSGNALVDSRTDGNCGGVQKYGAYAAGEIYRNGSANIKGQAGTDSNGNIEGLDYVDDDSPLNPVNANTFENFKLSDVNLDTLKELAKKNGTYFGPGYSGITDNTGSARPGTWSGSVTFNSTNKLKNGVVFIDTLTGANMDANMDPSQMANVTVHGNPFITSSFEGMFIVNGSAFISGNMEMNALVYVQNDLIYNGTGTGQISGLVISQNMRDTTAISDVDTSQGGNSRIRLNCDSARGRNLAPRNFWLVTGTYREIEGQ
jgi:hypothetical protein